MNGGTTAAELLGGVGLFLLGTRLAASGFGVAAGPHLRRRFASIHLRRLEAGAEVFERRASRVGRSLPYDALDFARFISALDSGGVLEEFVEGPGSAFDLSRDAVLKLLGPPVE